MGNFKSKRILYAIHDYQCTSKDDISFVKGDRLRLFNDSDDDWWLAQNIRNGSKGLIPKDFIAFEGSLECYEFFHGKVSRKEADKLLLNTSLGRGTFLIRYPDQNKPGFSLSIKTKNADASFSVKHYKINTLGEQFYIAKNDLHLSLDALVNNYKKARAEIVGTTVRYLTPGSTLKLICRVLQSTEKTAYIFWYHNNRMINYDVDRGINVSTEADFHYSELTIQHANKEHSGNYTCVPQNSQPASTIVHIFKGDHPAAMYHEHRSSATNIYWKSDALYKNLLLLLFVSSLLTFYNTNLNIFTDKFFSSISYVQNPYANHHQSQEISNINTGTTKTKSFSSKKYYNDNVLV